MTSKLQVTIPKALARQYAIAPGSEIDWFPAGDAIRVVPRRERREAADPSRRLDLFDRATIRQQARESASPEPAAAADRGWRREELYGHGGAD